MSITHVRTIGVGLCFFITSAASASATTYVVDASGSGQFTDIQPAIDAAQPGDVLLVLNGSYSAFTLSKGLSIIGYGAPSVAGVASILAVPAGETAVVVNVTPTQLSIGGCMGPVLVQQAGTIAHVDVQQSADVRLRGILMEPPDGPAADACTVDASRVEIAIGQVFGSSVPACQSGPIFNGGRALVLNHSSRVQLALSDVVGGDGAPCDNPTLYGGNGGDGVSLGTGDVLFVAGGGVSHIWGGDGGGDMGFTGNCDNDGYPGSAVVNQGGDLWYSGTFLINPGLYFGNHCIYIPFPPYTGPTLVTPDDPTLDVQGNPTAGGSELFTLRAPPGATAILYFGRHPIVVPTPHVLIEQLTQKSRIVNLGTIPASGQASFTWPIAAGLQPGTLLIAQAELTISPGQVRRTNSVPVILR